MKEQGLRVLGIDLSAMFRRHYEAEEGKAGKAFARTLEDVAAEREGFDRVVVCLDGGRSFRAFFDPQYKLQRERPPSAYYEQQKRAIERLEADGCTVLAAPEIDLSHAGGPAEGLYAEGDDVIATLAAWCKAEGHTLRILGGDKDLLQLVDDAAGIEVKRPDIVPPLLDGQTALDAAWREAHVERFHKAEEDKKTVRIGVKPNRIADVLALAGDASDNFSPFPGWTEEPTEPGGKPTKKPGIGMVIAIRLVQKFGSALGVIDAVDAEVDGVPLIKGHVAEVLRRGRPDPINAALRGLNLATLRHDLPIDCSVIAAPPVVRKIAAAEKPASFAAPAEDALSQVVAARFARIDAQNAAKEPPAAPIPDATFEPVAALPKHDAPRDREEPLAPAPRTSTALARVEPQSSGIDRYAFQPRDLGQLFDTAQALHNSRLYPQYGNPEAIMAVAIEAGERGIPIGTALRNAYVVKGKPAWATQLLAGLVLASPSCKVFRIVETEMDRAVLEYQRTDEAKPSRFTFTIEEAKRAKWVVAGSKWETNPRTMLRWAAMREAARAFFPDVVAGMYTPDEIRGFATDEEIEADAA